MFFLHAIQTRLPILYFISNKSIYTHLFIIHYKCHKSETTVYLSSTIRRLHSSQDSLLQPTENRNKRSPTKIQATCKAGEPMARALKIT